MQAFSSKPPKRFPVHARLDDSGFTTSVMVNYDPMFGLSLSRSFESQLFSTMLGRGLNPPRSSGVVPLVRLVRSSSPWLRFFPFARLPGGAQVRIA